MPRSRRLLRRAIKRYERYGSISKAERRRRDLINAAEAILAATPPTPEERTQELVRMVSARLSEALNAPSGLPFTNVRSNLEVLKKSGVIGDFRLDATGTLHINIPIPIFASTIHLSLGSLVDEKREDEE